MNGATGALVFAVIQGNEAAGSISDETAACLAQLASQLESSGSSIERLQKVNCYLSEDQFRAEFWNTWDAHFAGRLARPVRVTQVVGLPPATRVLLDAVASSNIADQASPAIQEYGARP